MAAYLFAHFIGDNNNGEQIYFSISKDGLHWKDLNYGSPIVTSKLGEGGVRDPFLVKHPVTNTYYLIATDLRMETRKDWGTAVTKGSKDIMVWESKNLIDWSEQRACTVGIPSAGCVWAPEAIYDEEKQAFLVFWASFVKEAEEETAKHRIYCSYTNDFQSFTEPQKYIELDMSIIDTTMIYDAGMYYRFTKDERTGTIMQEKGTSLIDGQFTVVANETLSSLTGLEGPECYRLPDGKWCLICDQFAAHKGYMPLVFDDLDSGVMHILPEEAYYLGDTKKRHGGVISISDAEYESLWNEYGKIE